MDETATAKRLRRPGIVGRDELLERLGALAAVARTGRGSAVALVGPPGIGKTALSEALAADLDAATVLSGRCVAPPSRPLRALSELVVDMVTAGAELGRVDETAFGAGVRLLLGDQLSTEVVHPAPVIGAGLRLLIEQLDGLVVCRVEDLHWADDETLAVVDDLVDHAERSRMIMVLTARVHASDATDRVMHDWTRRGVAELITVPPLADDDVAILIRRVAGDTIAAERVDQIVASTEGSPLLAESFARDARDLGPGRHPARLPPPPSFREAVLRRLNGLPGAVRSHVCLSALIGRTLDPDVLTACGLEGDEIAAAGAAVVRAQLAESGSAGEPIRLHHDLTRDAIVESLDPEERRRLARGALDAMLGSELDADGLAIAAQLARAAGDDDRAVRLLIEAARQALVLGVTTTTLARLDLAAGLPDAKVLHGPTLQEVRLEALAQAGRASDALMLGESLLHDDAFTQDGDRVTRLILALARASGSLTDWPGAAQRLDETFDLSVAPPEVQSYRAVAAMELGDVDQARQLAAVVLEHANAPAAAVCEAHEVLGRVARERSYSEAAGHFRAGVGVATNAGLGLWRARSLLELGLCEATIEGQPDVFEEASRRARHIGAVGLSAMCDYNLANLFGLLVRPDEALTVANRGITSARQIDVPILQALCWTAAGQAHAELGESGQARYAADQARAAAPDNPEVEALALGMCQAFSAMLHGALAESAALYAESLSILRSLPVVTATAPWYFGPVVLAVTDHASLEEVRRQLHQASFQAVPTITTFTHLVEAVVAGREEGPEAAEVCLAELRSCKQRYHWFASRAVGMWALMEGTANVAALRHGWGQPVAVLSSAQRTLDAAGATHTSRWFGAVLREAGVTPRRRGRARGHVPASLESYGLTAREYEVLQLLGERLTNREIARQLGVAPSTVKTHVERLLAKTGRRNRVELAELVAALGESATVEPR